MTFKPFSRTEMKMLIYNKVQRGMKYDEAVKELTAELKIMNANAFAKSSAKRVEENTTPLPHNLNIKKEVNDGKRLRKRILPD